MRVQRATMEMEYQDRFDAVVLNDDLEQAKRDAGSIVKNLS